MNIRAKFEVRNFTRSWDNRGYWKNLGRPWIRPRSLFSQMFKQLLFACTLWIYLPNLNFVGLRVPEIIGGTGKICTVPGYAHAPFSRKFLTGFCSHGPVNISAKFEVCSYTRSRDKRGYWTNYVMTSHLTSRSLHRLSVWIVWTHYAVDDFVKIWSNSGKTCGRYSMLKVVMSQLWRHRVTWCHRGGHHSIEPGHFPIGSQ